MNRLIELVQRNGVIMLIAVFLSWLIWYQVRLELTDQLDVIAEYRIIHPDNVRVRGPTTGEIEVRISGSRDEIARIADTRRIYLRFRVFGADETKVEQRIRFTAKDAERNEGEYRVERLDPVEVHFSVVHTKEVPVFARLDTDGVSPTMRLPDLGKRIESGRLVRIEGPKALVDAIKELSAGSIAAKDHEPEEGSGSRSVSFDVPVVPIENIRIDGPARFELPWIVEQSLSIQVPLEVHWVYDIGADPAEAHKTWVTLNEDLDENVTRTSKGFVLEVNVIGDLLDNVDQLRSTIRAYVRPDELPDEGTTTLVHFANVPTGVRIELKNNNADGKISVASEKR